MSMNANIDINDTVYSQQLSHHIKSLLNSTSKVPSFYQIITKAEGASPISVKAVLDTFGAEFIYNKLAHIVSKEDKSSTNKNRKILSDPHPADYDWRFNSRTITKYLNELSLAPHKKIALLGTKTIFTGLIDRHIDTIIFNKSSSLLNDFRSNGYIAGLVECDLFNMQPKYNNSFDLVIADPPWYLEFYKAFINRSSEFLRLGGVLHLSVLQKFTRPNAEKDIKEVIQYASKVGLKLIEKKPRYFTYETPIFEQNTLKVNNLYCQNWRKSDLYIFEKLAISETNIQVDDSNNLESWVEFRWKNKKIKIRDHSRQDDALFNYEPADRNNLIFTNVSRRSPYRKRIDIWTSDNFAFKVNKTKVLVSYFEYLSLGKSHNKAVSILKEQYFLSKQEILNLTKLIETIFE